MRRISIIGLGRGDGFVRLLKDEELFLSYDTVAVYSLPKSYREILKNHGIKLLFLDEVEKNIMDLSLGDLRERMAEEVLRSVGPEGAVACLLPGRPWSGAGLYQALKKRVEKEDCSLGVFTGEDLFSPVLEFSQEEKPDLNSYRGVMWIDALNLEELREPPRGELFITHAGSGFILEKTKEILLTLYPSSHPIDIFKFDKEGVVCRCGNFLLEDLQKVGDPHCWTFLRVPPRPYYYLGDMVHLMKKLRSPEGCPWDREQNHQTLRPFLLEETYEVLEAIDNEEPLDLCEELGDLLLQVLFHSQLAAEKNEFYLWQVIDGISRKIYRRHPHVFQNEKARDAREVSIIWQQIKEKEKGRERKDRFKLPQGFPALLRAQKVQKKASELGFDWPDMQGPVSKIYEELDEFNRALEDDRKENIAEEMGDLFFSLVNVARFLGVNAEMVLNRAVDKFIRRFRYIDARVQSLGGDYNNFSLQDLDVWWEEAKDKEKDNEKT